MKKLRNLLQACMESKIDEGVLPEPPTVEKDKQYVVMPGPLSTVFALTLMKKYSREDNGENAAISVTGPNTAISEEQATPTSQVDSTEKTQSSQSPGALAMEMQMAYIDEVMDKVESDTNSSQEEIANGIKRFQNYYTLTTKTQHVNLEHVPLMP